MDVGTEKSLTQSRNSWSAYARRYLMVAGALCTVYWLVAGFLYANGWWQWQKDGPAIESPSKRYAVTPAVIVYPRLRFGLVLSDRKEGREQVLAGWTGSSSWSREITWTAGDVLRSEGFEQNSLRWGRKSEPLGLKVDWILVSETGE